MTELKFIYGPVYSWRLGMSLGIDPVPADEKICNLGCIYCQLGITAHFHSERKVYVQAKEIIKEIKQLPGFHIDYFTFSGRGEPTLAKNLGEMIEAVRKVRKEKIAVITNATLMDREDVQKDLSLADFVIAKLDASRQESYQRVDRPMPGLDFQQTVKGLKAFRQGFQGILAVQIMFIKANKEEAREIADITKTIMPDEVQLDTPLRPSSVKPLSQVELEQLEKYFNGLQVKTVYEAKHKAFNPINEKETIKRHGQYKNRV